MKSILVGGGVSDRAISNFGPVHGIENRGGAVGGVMGVSSNRCGATTLPMGGAESRKGNDWNGVQGM